jgi:hypothetical protein
MRRSPHNGRKKGSEMYEYDGFDYYGDGREVEAPNA